MTNQNQASASFNEANAITALIRSVINGRSKAGLGQVVAVYPETKTVDILPLSSGQDKDGNEKKNVPVYGISYFRHQAGNSAIIIDPVIGDIGLYVCCDEDISRIVATKKEGIPATKRRDSKSDAVYFGAVLGSVPTQYVKFSDSGIDIVTPNDVTVTCKNLKANVTEEVEIEAQGKVIIKSDADVEVTGVNVKITASAQASITAPAIALNGAVTQSGGGGAPASFSSPIQTPDTIVNGISVKDHTHGGVESGPNSTGGMQ